MASLTSRPWNNFCNHGYFIYNNYNYKLNNLIFSHGCGGWGVKSERVMVNLSELWLQKRKKRKGSPAPAIGDYGGPGGDRRRWVGEVVNGVIADLEEDKRFVEVLREAHPYIFAHVGRTFAVVLSAEIIASPCLDTILKVPPELSPPLF